MVATRSSTRNNVSEGEKAKRNTKPSKSGGEDSPKVQNLKKTRPMKTSLEKTSLKKASVKKTNRKSSAQVSAKKKKQLFKKAVGLKCECMPLNFDCIEQIVSYLPCMSRINLMQVSRDWRKAAGKFTELDLQSLTNHPNLIIEPGYAPRLDLILNYARTAHIVNESQMSLKRVDVSVESTPKLHGILMSVPGLTGVTHAVMQYDSACYIHASNKGGLLSYMPSIQSLVLACCYFELASTACLVSEILPPLESFEFYARFSFSETSANYAKIFRALSSSTRLMHVGFDYTPALAMALVAQLQETPSLPGLNSLYLRSIGYPGHAKFLEDDEFDELQTLLALHEGAKDQVDEWHPERKHMFWYQVFHILCIVLAPRLTVLHVRIDTLAENKLRSLSLLTNLRSLHLTLCLYTKEFQLSDINNLLENMLGLWDLHITARYNYGGVSKSLEKFPRRLATLGCLTASVSRLTELQNLRVPLEMLRRDVFENVPVSLRTLIVDKGFAGTSTNPITDWFTREFEEIVKRCPDLTELDLSSYCTPGNAAYLIGKIDSYLLRSPPRENTLWISLAPCPRKKGWEALKKIKSGKLKCKIIYP